MPRIDRDSSCATPGVVMACTARLDERPPTERAMTDQTGKFKAIAFG